jgi:hypothetical protein
MKIELDLPEKMVKDLREKSASRGLSLDAYATELVYQLLAQEQLGEEGKIENRPDWQAALGRSRADLAAERTIEHEEVEAWHRGHHESSGQTKP